MNDVALRRTRPVLALTLTKLVLIALSAVGLSANFANSATAQADSQTMLQVLAPQCGPDSLIHAATQEYRMFYDQSFITAQRISAATNRYRQFYDQGYIAQQRSAAATAQNCLAAK